MGDTRFKNGLAYGPYGGFAASSSNVLPQADATPDVTNGNLFYTNNTSNTTITHLDLSVPGGGAGSNADAFEGKYVRLVFLDNSTGLANAGNLRLASSNNLAGANNCIDFVYHNSAWIEVSRSYNQSNVATVTSAGLSATAAAGTGDFIITGRGPTVTLLLNAAATTPIVLRRVVGGQIGQFLNVIAVGGSHALVIVNSAQNDTFVCVSSGSSTQFRLPNSANVLFIRNHDKWHEVTPIVAGTGGISVGV